MSRIRKGTKRSEKENFFLVINDDEMKFNGIA